MAKKTQIHNNISDEMKSRFVFALKQNCGVAEPGKVLIAVSGGPDSMALLHLFKESGFNCYAAHCNFLLRGEESDKDEAFVIEMCKKWNIEYICKQFETVKYAENNGISIEMAARELRYNWFNQLTQQYNIQHISTGHHGDDSIETFLLNLSRGTGLKGLTGIKWKRRNIIRPLLFATSEDIENYCNENNIPFRSDSTNTETTIIRNKIRHQIIPLFKEINPGFFNTMQNNMQYLKDALDIFSNEAKRVSQQIVAGEGDSKIIPIRLINEHPQRKSMLFEILTPYGYSSNTIPNIIDSMDRIPGKQFFSKKYRLVVDRFNLILTPKKEVEIAEYYIDGGETFTNTPVQLYINVFPKDDNFSFSTNPNTVHLDADLVDFPLTIRKTHAGDRFQPLGMERFKKISDFFIDEKFSIIDKENTWLMLSGEDIIWVIGHRIDNRYKITHKTERILELELDSNSTGFQ